MKRLVIFAILTLYLLSGCSERDDDGAGVICQTPVTPDVTDDSLENHDVLNTKSGALGGFTLGYSELGK